MSRHGNLFAAGNGGTRLTPGFFELNGKRYTLRQLRKQYGVAEYLIYSRVHSRKWTVREAVGLDTRPKQRRAKGPQKRVNHLKEFTPITAENAVPQARIARLLAGKTLRVAAEELGVSTSHLFFMEREQHHWKDEIVDRFNAIAKGWVIQ